MSTDYDDDDDVATVIAPARKVLGDGMFPPAPLPAAGVPAAPSSRRPLPQPPLAAPYAAPAPQASLPAMREPGTATRITAVKLGAPLWVKLYLAVTSLMIATGIGALIYLKLQGAW